MNHSLYNDTKSISHTEVSEVLVDADGELQWYNGTTLSILVASLPLALIVAIVVVVKVCSCCCTRQHDDDGILNEMGIPRRISVLSTATTMSTISLGSSRRCCERFGGINSSHHCNFHTPRNSIRYSHLSRASASEPLTVMELETITENILKENEEDNASDTLIV